MTTTELIDILRTNEFGGITGRSREISLTVNGLWVPSPDFKVDGTGDGLITDISLDVSTHKLDPDTGVVIGGRYRHFKGHIATVITTATDTESGDQIVIYYCSTDDNDPDACSEIYARPLDMFLSEVDHEKYPDVEQKMRFELIK